MFWRKKISTEEAFVHETTCRRRFYRHHFSEDEPVEFVCNGREARLLDIGAGGLSFPNPGLSPGDFLEVEIELPAQMTLVEGRLQVVEIDSQDICHCHFIDLAPEMEEVIHQYLLKKQKEKLRGQRRLKRIRG